MTEELSPILEDVTTEIWADEIRHIKIRELEDLIVEKEQTIRDTEFEKEDDKDSKYMSFRHIRALSEVSRLKRKLKIIKQ